MYSKFSNIIDKNGNKLTMSTLKPHHHIKVDQEFKLDCGVWRNFLLKQNDCGICRPFIDYSQAFSAEILDLYTDATKNENLGMGGIFGEEW